MLDQLINLFLENPLAQFIWILALIINIYVTIYLKNNKFIYWIIITSIAWGIHFLLMSLFSWALINFIDIIKNYASIRFKNNKNMMYFFIFIYFIVWIFFYKDIYSLLPVLASFIWIYSFFLLEWIKLKIWYFFVVVCWFLYWYIWKSIGWATADWFLMISSIIWIVKDLKIRK